LEHVEGTAVPVIADVGTYDRAHLSVLRECPGVIAHGAQRVREVDAHRASVALAYEKTGAELGRRVVDRARAAACRTMDRALEAAGKVIEDDRLAGQQLGHRYAVHRVGQSSGRGRGRHPGHRADDTGAEVRRTGRDTAEAEA